MASEGDIQAWKDIEKRALKRKGAPDKSLQGKAREAKRQAKVPKLSTWEWLVGMDSALFDTIGHGLEWYKPRHVDRPFDDDFEENEEDTDAVLIVCTDEEQKQLVGYYYLERHARFNVVRHQPPLHRRHNDLVNALAKSNLYEVLALTVLQRNIAYGPWNKGGNLQQLWEGAMEMMALLTPDSPFLLRMWPLICKGRGWVDEERTNRAARAAFLKELCTFRPFACKGPRAAPSKWMSFINAIGYEMPDHGVKLMGIAYLSLAKGWVDDLESFFGQSFFLADEKADVLEKRFGSTAPASSSTCTSASSSGAPSSSSSASKPMAPPSRAAAKAKARAKVTSMIAKSQNALMAVGRLMANTEFHDLQQVIFILCQPLAKEHASTVKMFKTREGVLEYYKGMGLGSWLEPLWGAVDCLRLWHYFDKVSGLTTSLSNELKERLTPDSDAVIMEDNLCHIIWRFVICLLAERAGSCQYASEHYPGILAGLLGSAEEKQQTLARFKDDWETYCMARKSRSPAVQKICDRSSLDTRVMHQVARIAKKDDFSMSQDLLDRVLIIFGGINQEDILEDTLGKVRDTEYRDASSRVLRHFKVGGSAKFEIPK